MTYPHDDPDQSAPTTAGRSKVWRYQTTDSDAWNVVSGEECTLAEITRCLRERYRERFVAVKAMGD